MCAVYTKSVYVLNFSALFFVVVVLLSIRLKWILTSKWYTKTKSVYRVAEEMLAQYIFISMKFYFHSIFLQRIFLQTRFKYKNTHSFPRPRPQRTQRTVNIYFVSKQEKKGNRNNNKKQKNKKNVKRSQRTRIGKHDLKKNHNKKLTHIKCWREEKICLRYVYHIHIHSNMQAHIIYTLDSAFINLSTMLL